MLSFFVNLWPLQLIEKNLREMSCSQQACLQTKTTAKVQTLVILLSAGADVNKQGSFITIFVPRDKPKKFFQSSNFEQVLQSKQNKPQSRICNNFVREKHLSEQENAVHRCSPNSFSMLIEWKF